jgi:hypothetical protein
MSSIISVLEFVHVFISQTLIEIFFVLISILNVLFSLYLLALPLRSRQS